MLVRPATQTDLPQILEIHNHAILHLDAIWTETEETLDDRRAWLAERQDAGFAVLVAEEDGTVLGHASYGPYRSRSGYRKTIEHSIYLRTGARGRGVGRALMEALIADARDKGFHLMVAVIDAQNQGSVRFHQSFGFTPAGLLPQAGFKHGKWLDQLNMALLLNHDPAPPKGY